MGSSPWRRCGKKIFFVLTWLAQGPSFLDPKSYAIMHLEHHRHSDSVNDPHSPLNFSRSKFGLDVAIALVRMMLATREIFVEIRSGAHALVAFYRTRRFPEWPVFQRFASSRISMVVLAMCYVSIYWTLVPVWWCWFFLPLTLINGPIQGAIVNWCGHMWGSRRFHLPDNSRNTPLSPFMLGETNQNNHHADPGNPNFARRWYEFDVVFVSIRLLHAMGVITLIKRELPSVWQ